MAKRLSVTNDQIVSELTESYGSTVTTAQVTLWAKAVGYTPSTILNRLSSFKSGRGKYTLEAQKLEKAIAAPAAEPVGEVKTIIKEAVDLVPTKDENFVPFGNFTDVKKVLKSKIFYPLFITGLSGNGKTHGVEQACAQLGRDLVRVNITIETDEDDLIGGFRLVNGETVWHDGPVVEALKVQFSSSMRLTWPLIRLCVFSHCWKVRVSISRRLTPMFVLLLASTLWPLLTPKDVDLSLVSLSAPTC